MKSGTSFIQAVCDHNRPALRSRGILFVGDKWKQQVDAVKELIALNLAEGDQPAPDGAWDRLVREINGWPDTAVVSMEFLAPRSAAKIQFILDSFPDTDVQVVLTARDTGRNIPAMWVESMQNRGVSTWEEFRAGVRQRGARAPRWSRWFWRHQDIAAIAERWQSVVGRERFTLITVPHPGAPKDLLWRRFCEFLGIEAEGVNLDVASNPSIGAASATVLRELNVRLAESDVELTDREYNRRIKGLLAKRGLARVHGDRQTHELKERWVRRLAADQVKSLRALDPRVIGDLAELEAVPVSGVATVSPQAELDAAYAAMGIMAERWMIETRRLRKRLATREGGAE
jgi:hypothetical protein